MATAAIIALVLSLTGLQLPVAVATAIIGGQSIGAVLGGLTLVQDISLAGFVFSEGKKVVKFDIALYRVLQDPRVQAAIKAKMAANGEYVIRVYPGNVNLGS